MRPVYLTKTLTAAVANAIALAQSVGSNGVVTLNGSDVTAGVWTLDTQRRIAIASSGNDSALTATINGFSGSGQAISEVLALTNAGTAVSALNYLSGGTITLSGASAGTITIGTDSIGSTDWIMPNFHMTPFNIECFVEVTGTVNWSLEVTLDNYWQPGNPPPHIVAIASGIAISAQETLTTPVTGYRYTINSGTGTLTAQSVQAGISNF